MGALWKLTSWVNALLSAEDGVTSTKCPWGTLSAESGVASTVWPVGFDVAAVGSGTLTNWCGPESEVDGGAARPSARKIADGDRWRKALATPEKIADGERVRSEFADPEKMALAGMGADP